MWHGLLTDFRQSFSDVLITGDGVDAVSFMHASDDFLHMFGELQLAEFPPARTPLTQHTDLVGSSVFGFVQNDLKTNLAVRSICWPAAPVYDLNLPAADRVCVRGMKPRRPNRRPSRSWS